MIFINYGIDWVRNTFETLTASDIGAYLKSGFSVSIKPNLVNERSADSGATTHPEVIEGIILFLIDFGVKDIKIIENSSAGHNTKKAYKMCGYETLQKKYDVKLIDLQSDNFKTLKYEGIDLKISGTALDSDFLINAPVLKAHSQTRLTCCMKNLKGCMPQSEMRRFHTLGLHKPIAALNALLRCGYCVVDGICGDLSFEEGGTPVQANRIIAGRNPVLIDSYCAELIGYKPDDIGYLSYGREFMLGDFYCEKTKVIELNQEQKSAGSVKSERIADRYRDIIDDNDACSVCYAALVFALHRVNGEAARNKKICIGQGFKGKKSGGTGIGNCAGGFTNHVKGCPPKAVDIIQFLEKQLKG